MVSFRNYLGSKGFEDLLEGLRVFGDICFYGRKRVFGL